MEHLTNDQKELCNETGHPIVNLMEIQWKSRLNNMIRISQWREAFTEQMLGSEERNKSKRAGL